MKNRFTNIFSLTLGSTFLAGLTAAASVAYLYSLRKPIAGRDADRMLVDDESADHQRGGDEDEDDEDFRSATETVYANHPQDHCRPGMDALMNESSMIFVYFTWFALIREK